jgi:hypothetical protein
LNCIPHFEKKGDETESFARGGTELKFRVWCLDAYFMCHDVFPVSPRSGKLGGERVCVLFYTPTQGSGRRPQDLRPMRELRSTRGVGRARIAGPLRRGGENKQTMPR